MKRNIRRTVRTNSRRAEGERGSVTLEAAMVMPVFLLLVFFLLFLVKTSVIAMSLHGTLSQTVRLAAASWYPVSFLQSDPGSAKGEDIRQTVREFAGWLPAPLGDWAESLSAESGFLEGEAAKLAFRQLALKLADPKALEESRLRITAVELPKPGRPETSYLTVEAEYTLPFRVPFTGRSLVIRAAARERAWVGGSPSHAGSSGGNGSLQAAFVSLEPNPVRPGRKATLVLRTTPGAVLDLSVLYKSGRSQAKHLGTAVAGADGRISWTWLVSGNTTSGLWNWEAKGDGGAALSRPFQVARIGEAGDE